MTTDARFLTPVELTSWLQDRGVSCSVTSVRRWLAAGALPGRRLGRAWYTPRDHLERWQSGLPTVTDPAMISALQAIEAGAVQQLVADSTVPSVFVRRRELVA